MSIKKFSVEQFYNKNQFLIRSNGEVFLQSYDSLVCEYDPATKTLFLGVDWDYSNTTRKHVYKFIEEYTNVYLADNGNKRKQVEKLLREGKILPMYEGEF